MIKDYIYQISSDSDERFPPYTGREFIANHDGIDQHDYPEAFGQFIALGLDPDIANILAFGENRFDLISEHIDHPLRHKAFEVFDRLVECGYWSED